MSELPELLRDLGNNPSDNDTRGMIADWFVDRDDVALHHFWHTQTAVTSGDMRQMESLQKQFKALQKEERFAAVLQDAQMDETGQLQINLAQFLEGDNARIITEQLGVRSLKLWLPPQLDTTTHQPITPPYDLTALARCESLKYITSLNIAVNDYTGVALHGGVDAEGAKQLAESSHLKHLRVLELQGYGIGREGAQALAGSENLQTLTALHIAASHPALQHLGYNHSLTQRLVGHSYATPPAGAPRPIGPEGMRALAESPYLKNLLVLDLKGNAIGAAGMGALAAAENFAGLTSLNLRHNHLTSPALETLAASPSLRQLVHLNLSYNPIGGGDNYVPYYQYPGMDAGIVNDGANNAGINALANSLVLAKVQDLVLSNTRLSDVNLQHLAVSPHFNPRRLVINDNYIGMYGLGFLAGGQSPRRLETLGLPDYTNTDALGLLATSTQLPKLKNILFASQHSHNMPESVKRPHGYPPIAVHRSSAAWDQFSTPVKTGFGGDGYYWAEAVRVPDAPAEAKR